MENNFIESLKIYLQNTNRKEVLKQLNKCKNIGVSVEDFLRISEEYERQ